MNFVPVITHAVAILLGWLVVSFGTLPDPAGFRAHHPGIDDPAWSFRSGKSGPHPGPRSLLDAQANQPMEPDRRSALKRRILMDWAGTDPDGLLQYLHDRPWLAGHDNAATRALEGLARTRPRDLLAYAKNEGCLLAIATLHRDGDPRIALDLLLSLPDGYFSNDVFEGILGDLFVRGCEIDPTFHEHLHAIGDAEMRAAVLEDVAGTLLAAKREDDLYSWVNENVDLLPADEIASAISRQLVLSRSDLNGLHRLPRSVQPPAIDSALQSLASAHVYIDEGYQQACFNTFLQNGWLDGRQDLAASVITTYYQAAPDDNLRRKTSTAWKNWALDLPPGPKWDPIRRTAIRRWALEDPNQWSTITDLPTEDLRNAAYTAVVHTIDREEHAEHLPWILEQITDPSLRTIATEVLARRLESDPDSHIHVDPFQPLAER